MSCQGRAGLTVSGCHLAYLHMATESAERVGTAVLPFGRVSVVWHGNRVARVELNRRRGRLDRQLKGEIIAVLRGARFPPRLRPRLDVLSGFSRKVLQECARVSFGQVVTYAGLARRAGNPRAARAVGRVLANSPFPLLIPCHRVVRSDMRLGGFGGGSRMKQSLLESEGWRVVRGKVVRAL